MIDGSVHIVNLSARNALAERLRALRDRRHVLLLPNAWDAGSARMFADMGFAAIATTSGGVAWSLGYADGEAVPFDELLAAVRRMARAARVPLTVDFEAGFGATPADVNRLLKQYQGMEKMMSKFSMGGMKGLMRGMKGMMGGRGGFPMR